MRTERQITRDSPDYERVSAILNAEGIRMRVPDERAWWIEGDPFIPRPHLEVEVFLIDAAGQPIITKDGNDIEIAPSRVQIMVD
ncbi:hypothetical protein SEA_JAMZY_3 [Gordonia phage Jamzy]|nr:hypothetical protein SEA_JAMZY_3 [Gordonia phage Jamzy]